MQSATRQGEEDGGGGNAVDRMVARSLGGGGVDFAGFSSPGATPPARWLHAMVATTIWQRSGVSGT